MEWSKPFLGLGSAAILGICVTIHKVIIRNLSQFNSMTLVTCRFAVMTMLAVLWIGFR